MPFLGRAVAGNNMEFLHIQTQLWIEFASRESSLSVSDDGGVHCGATL